MGLPLSIIFSLWFALILSSPLQAKTGDSCIDCHSDSNFLVTNQKLHRYYQDWLHSPHYQAGVNCSACHRGDPKTSNKTKAHKSKGKSLNALNFKNIPKTCSTCHQDIYKGYKKSLHSKKLKEKGKHRLGPNCVTCHGAMSNAALNVTTVRQTCASCHNAKLKSRPEVPAQVESLLNKFLSIHRFYRYVSTKGDPVKTREFLLDIDQRMKQLSKKWHSFNLEAIAADTHTILELLQKKRKEIAKKAKK